MRLSELALRLGAELRAETGDDPDVRGVASFAHASASDLVFAESDAALETALASQAGAVVVRRGVEVTLTPRKALLVVEDAKLSFAVAAHLLRVRNAQAQLHPAAEIASDAILGQQVSVGAFAVVGAGAEIGDDCVIGEGAVVGEGVKVGRGCHLYPRVVVYPGAILGNGVVAHAGAVLGADGFGYVRDPRSGAYVQFPQQGTLVIEDEVEIGANTTIDRGALEETRIGRGTKIDNLVHIGHNVRVGHDVVIAAQTGVSGSSAIGDGAIVGGQVGIADHVVIGEQVILGAQAGIPSRKKLKGPGVVFWGTPARPIKQYLKELATLARLTRPSK
ncbi:MAG: UDP-3-O-(3-hydroxymyristoyl)glucosamine N-acyltransferase [Acidobacteriaceae bacterium]